MTQKPNLILGRPADRSFEAYVAFINRMYEALTGKPAGEMDEAQTAEMQAAWREFWADAEPSHQERELPEESGAEGATETHHD